VRVLFADDDAELVDLAAYALTCEGATVVAATDGAQALRCWQADKPDLVILDIDMPTIDGLQVCRQIRDASSTPVIILTAAKDEAHVLQAFLGGADDYVTKPFSLKELKLRIQAVMRRTSRQTSAISVKPPRVGRFTIDAEAHALVDDDSVVYLTPLEYQIISKLVLNAGHVVSYEALEESTWGHFEGRSSLLKRHIFTLHKKLGTRKGEPGHIRAVPRLGYTIDRL